MLSERVVVKSVVEQVCAVMARRIRRLLCVCVLALTRALFWGPTRAATRRLNLAALLETRQPLLLRSLGLAVVLVLLASSTVAAQSLAPAGERSSDRASLSFGSGALESVWLERRPDASGSPHDAGDIADALDRPLGTTLRWARAAQGYATTLSELRERVAEFDTSALADWRAQLDITALDEQAAQHADDLAVATLWAAAAESMREAENRILSAERRLEELEARLEASAAVFDSLDERMQITLREFLALREIDLEGATVAEIETAIARIENELDARLIERSERERLIARLQSQRGAAQTPTATGNDPGAAGADSLPEGVSEAELEAAGLTAAYRAWREAVARDAEAQELVATFDQRLIGERIEVLELEAALEEWRDRVRTLSLRALRSFVELRSNAEIEALRERLRELVRADPPRFEGSTFEQETISRLDDAATQLTRASRAAILARQAEQLTDELATTLADIRERLEIGGLTDVLGGVLVEEERRLRRLGDFAPYLRDVQRELAQARLRSIGLRDELRRAERLITIPDLDSREDRNRAAEQAAQRDTQTLTLETLSLLERSDRQLIDNLLQAERAFSALIETSGELRTLLRESLLWWPSHRPVSFSWLGSVPAASLALFDPRTWTAMHEALVEAVMRSPLLSIFVVVVASAIAVFARGARAHLRDLARQTQHRYTDRLALTWAALGWTAVRVLPVPIVLVALGWQLTRVESSSREIEIVAFVTLSIALWWAVAHLLYLFTSPDGVARAHFRWPTPLLRRLRIEMAWFLPSQLALMLLAAAAFGHPQEIVADVWGRLALIGILLVVGAFAWRMLGSLPAPGDDNVTSSSLTLPAQSSSAASAGLIGKSRSAERHRRFIRGMLMLSVAALLILSLAGYLLTVATLLERAINTVIVAVVAWIGYSLAARALVLSEVRLQLQHMREARAREAAPTEATVGEGAVIDVAPPISIENVNAQTRSLLRVTTGTAVVLALLWVWADVLPALTWLDGVTLWSRTISVGESEILSRVSLQDFLLAVFLGVAFTAAARNLPGLVEILLSRSALLDAAGRYTVTTLLRYALAVIAVISVFSLLGLRWSELQWMVAALTLGLGFGLQEVVANFVSGLIMLFERPARVGDTITIGEYSGTVSKIRTRATTIVDWDNREVVVPNKMFITERLINWTLSDTMTRVVIPVGVSYSADPDRVMQALSEVAAEHPQVLSEPAPQVLFMRFGDSALDFELRAYVAVMRDRLVTISDLHRAIVRRFRDENIEIAFPQLDLHVRDWAPTSSMPGSEPRSAS